MQRSHAMIGLASLVGAALIAGPALAVTALSPTGHLNVRSGPGLQYPVVGVMQQNEPAAIPGCIQDYSWCSVAVGAVTGWASAPYLVTDAGGKPTNLQVSGAQLGIP
ncbi:MAG: SH3 domain-containing protein, partial [Methyloceanibacter sp.]